MYKLTILFFFLTAFNSTGLMDNYKITFDYEYSSYILKVNDGELIFQNNQPNVSVTPIGDNAANTDKTPLQNTGKIYIITKGATFEEGLKIGGMDDIDIDAKIGEMDDIDIDAKIGGIDDIDITAKIYPLLSDEKDHQAYDIILSYALVTIVEKSSNVKQQFAIGDGGLFVYIKGDKFNLLSASSTE